MKRGFTLVELLVVITIIAILAAIGLTIYSTAQKAGRTAKRLQDLRAIQTALELYYAKNKQYPTTSGAWFSECDDWGNKLSGDVIPGLVPNYMQEFPADPAMKEDPTGGDTSCYLYQSNGTDYKLLDHVIAGFNDDDYESRKELVDPARDGGSDPCTVESIEPSKTNIWSWAVYSSENSRCW